MHDYYAFKSYYPVRYQVDQQDEAARRLVYNFKDGYTHAQDEVAALVVNFLNENLDLKIFLFN